MLGRVVEKVSGLTMREYLMTRLFDKLEIWNPQWGVPQGTFCASGLYLTTEELSRLGIMLLQNGVYKDEEIVSQTTYACIQSGLIRAPMTTPKTTAATVFRSGSAHLLTLTGPTACTASSALFCRTGRQS